MLVGIHDNVIKGAARSSLFDCPVHGVQMTRTIGHHSTLQEAQIKNQIPKALRKALRKKLNSEERRRYDAAIHGRLLVDQNEIRRWVELAKS